MRCRLAVVFGVVVFLFGSLFREPPGLAAAEATSGAPRGSLAGQVLDPAGKPAAGATVWLVGGVYDKDPETIGKTTTDGKGRFVFLPGKSKWIQSGARYPHLVVRDRSGRLGGEPMPWAWGSGQPAPKQDLRIKLTEVEDCRGRLIDAAGKPIALATIRPRSVGVGRLGDPAVLSIGLAPELTAELTTQSDADGRFILRRLPAGGSVTSRVQATGVGAPVVTWNVKSEFVVRLDRVGNLRGAVVAPAGAKSLDTLKVSLYLSTDPQKAKEAGLLVSDSAETQLDRDRRFRFEGLAPGTGQISLGLSESDLPYYTKESVPVVVRPGETATVEMRLMPAVAVRGRVVDASDGKGIAAVGVSASKISEQGYMVSARHTKTDAEGRFVAYTEPGKVSVGVTVLPEGYVSPKAEREWLKMDAARDITWPVIKLERAARLEAMVVDQAGTPVGDAEVQFLVQRNMHELSSERTNREGVCSVGRLNAKDFLALRARTETAVSDVVEIRPADTKGPVRLVVSPAKVFRIRGRCVDAAGRPISQAKASISTSWMLGPSGLGFSVMSCATDAEGRLEAGPLWAGVQYHVSITADEYDKLETASFRSQPGIVHDVGRLTLVNTGGSVEGTVVDSGGRPVTGVRVFNSGDAPKTLSMETDTGGRFRLKGLRMGQVFVFAEKAGYRFAAVPAESPGSGVKIRLLRTDEPVPPWKPQRPATTFASQQEVVRRLLDKFWARPPHGRQSWTVQYMARIDPQQAMKWSGELGGRYDDLVRRITAEQSDAGDPDEILALLARQGDLNAYYALQRLATSRLKSDPQQALRFAEEMIQRARRIDQPDRAWALAAAGSLVARLGKTEAGRKLVEEAAGMAAKLGTDGRQVYIRGLVATALAPFDLPAAMALVERAPENYERQRALARIATAIAAKDLAKALEIIGRLDKQSTLPDMARTQIAYELAATRRDEAMRVVEGMDSHGAIKMKAEALGWMAKAVAPRDAKRAHSLIDKSIEIYWTRGEELRGWSSFGGRSAMAAFVVMQAREVGYPDMQLLINRLLAMRPAGEEMWSPRDAQQASILTASILAMVDPESAKQVLLAAMPEAATENAGTVMENLDMLQAWALVDLDHTVKLIESRIDASKGKSIWTNYLISTFDLLTTPPERRAEVLLRHRGGRWFPGSEL